MHELRSDVNGNTTNDVHVPRPRGFHPFTDVWILQVNIRFARIAFPPSTFTQYYVPVQNAFRGFVTEAEYLNYKSWLAGQPNQLPFISTVQDYGKQHWFNEKSWMRSQFFDIGINGNFVGGLQP